MLLSVFRRVNGSLVFLFFCFRFDVSLADGGEAALDLGPLLVVVGQVARLALAAGIQRSVSVPASSRVLVSTVLTVARGAHALGVVLSIRVRARRDVFRLGLRLA